MTPIEIIEAWRDGRKLEGFSRIDNLFSQLKYISIRIELENGCVDTVSIFPSTNIDWIRIKRETFGFDEARKRLREGNVIGVERTNYKFRLVSGDLQKGCEGKWFTLHGYPLDWPDSVDFYEVEE